MYCPQRRVSLSQIIRCVLELILLLKLAVRVIDDNDVVDSRNRSRGPPRLGMVAAWLPLSRIVFKEGKCKTVAKPRWRKSPISRSDR